MLSAGEPGHEWKIVTIASFSENVVNDIIDLSFCPMVIHDMTMFTLLFNLAIIRRSYIAFHSGHNRYLFLESDI